MPETPDAPHLKKVIDSVVLTRLHDHFEILIAQFERDEASAFSAESRVEYHVAVCAFQEALQGVQNLIEGKSLSTEIGPPKGYTEIACARCQSVWSQLTSEPVREGEICGECEEQDLEDNDVAHQESIIDGIRSDDWKAGEDR